MKQTLFTSVARAVPTPDTEANGGAEAKSRSSKRGARPGTASADKPRLVYSIEEVAAMLGINKHTAYSACSRGEIDSIRIGRRLLVPGAWIEKIRTAGSTLPAIPAAAAE